MLSQQIINGVVIGSVYILVAIAFSLMLTVLNFLNFAIPALFVAGGMLTWIAFSLTHSIVLSVMISVAGTLVLGLAVEKTVYWPTQGKGAILPLAGSLSILVLLQNVFLSLYGSEQQAFPNPFASRNLHVAGLVISTVQCAALLLSLFLVCALSWFLNHSSLGRQVRCLAENHETARLLGLRTRHLVSILFALTSGIAGLAGILFAFTYQQVSPLMGEDIGLKAVCAMIVGGAGTIWGAIFGGLLIGLTEVMTVAYIGSDFSNITVYGLLLLILLVRPTGLLGRPPVTEKV